MTDSVNGYILPNPADVDALTRAMLNLLDADARQQMRESSLGLRPNLSFEAHMDCLEEIYRTRMAQNASR
jgi:glycosyltransferase involved in cell wall biosynthesis